jgi:hypothetical protein
MISPELVAVMNKHKDAIHESKVLDYFPPNGVGLLLLQGLLMQTMAALFEWKKLMSDPAYFSPTGWREAYTANMLTHEALQEIDGVGKEMMKDSLSLKTRAALIQKEQKEA